MAPKEKVSQIKASELVMDWTLYPRAEMSSTHIAAMVEALKAGGRLPPIVAEAETKRLADGFHRLTAWRRFEGPDVKVPVILRPMKDPELFEAAMALNTGHGQNLSPYDKARCISAGESLGLSRDSIASALNMTKERLEQVILRRFTSDGEVVKRTLSHLAGEESLTDSQRAFNKKAGGMSQQFYLGQVIGLLEANAVDWENETVVEHLRTLARLLEERLTTVA